MSGGVRVDGRTGGRLTRIAHRTPKFLLNCFYFDMYTRNRRFIEHWRFPQAPEFPRQFGQPFLLSAVDRVEFEIDLSNSGCLLRSQLEILHQGLRNISE